MNIKDIPFIIPNFNQLAYLKNLINQIEFYYPENRIYVVDNGSNYPQLGVWYSTKQVTDVIECEENDFIGNLSNFLKHLNAEYYVITDPDISILPNTPPYFLEAFKTAIDDYGFHHAGFGLKTDDIPSWNPKAGWIQGDEKALLQNPVAMSWNYHTFTGYKAPIDTTFALYKRDNGGWSAPMPGDAWSNAVRIFEAIHLPWYLHKDYLNAEMNHYFDTCKKRVVGAVTAGSNHYNPFNGME